MPLSIFRIVPAVAKNAFRRDKIDRMESRVPPRHLDLNIHMNYASYLEVMEEGRWRWMAAAGLLPRMFKGEIKMVVGTLDITYRRELKPFQKFLLDTRVIGQHRRAIRFQQTFLVGDKVHAQSQIDILVLKGGSVISAEETEQWVVPYASEPLPITDWIVTH